MFNAELLLLSVKAQNVTFWQSHKMLRLFLSESWPGGCLFWMGDVFKGLKSDEATTWLYLILRKSVAGGI